MPMTELLPRVVAITLLAIAFGTLAAEDAVQSKQPEPAEATEPRQVPPAPARSPAQGPASTFTPSEQIKADSSVPFPVDI